MSETVDTGETAVEHREHIWSGPRRCYRCHEPWPCEVVRLRKEAQNLRWWGSDCIIEGGCEGNTTPDSMRCDSCGSNRYTVPLYVLDGADNGGPT